MPSKEGTEPTETLRHQSRTGTAAYRQASLAVQVLPSPFGLCHGKTSAQWEASATWNKQGSWPSEDGAKKGPGSSFSLQNKGLGESEGGEESTEAGDSTGKNYQ